MPIIHYQAPLKLIVAARGHPYDRSAFMAVFDEMEGVSASLVEQPAATRLMTPAAMAGYDALVLYDMPGLDFQHPDPPGYVMPDPAFVAGFEALLEAGIPVVALHHATAGWPAWPRWAEIMGGTFRYRAGPLRGAPASDGGYRHDVTYQARVLDKTHPVTRGLPDTFEMTDELYLFDCFEEDVIPLVRAEHDFIDRNFYSATRAVAGRMFDNEGWHRPSGTNLICWAKPAGNSPLVYIQPGDGPTAYQNPEWRQLVRNAIDWVVSAEAKKWARNAAAG